MLDWRGRYKEQPTLWAALAAAAPMIVLQIGLQALLSFLVMWLWEGLFTGTDSILGYALPPLTWYKAFALVVFVYVLTHHASVETGTKK